MTHTFAIDPYLNDPYSAEVQSAMIGLTAMEALSRPGPGAVVGALGFRQLAARAHAAAAPNCVQMPPEMAEWARRRYGAAVEHRAGQRSRVTVGAEPLTLLGRFDISGEADDIIGCGCSPAPAPAPDDFDAAAWMGLEEVIGEPVGHVEIFGADGHPEIFGAEVDAPAAGSGVDGQGEVTEGADAGGEGGVAELRLSPRTRLVVRYRLEGKTLLGTAVIHALGFAKPVQFKVQLDPIIQRLLDIHAAAHRRMAISGAPQPVIGFGFFKKMKKFFKKATRPLAKVAQKARKLVAKTVKGALNVARRAGLPIDAVAKAVKTARRKALALAKRVAGPVAKAFKATVKFAKDKVLGTLAKVAKTIVQSPITGAIVGALSVVFPPVGAPALAAYTTANTVLAGIDAAKYAAKTLKNIVTGKLNILKAAKGLAKGLLKKGAEFAAKQVMQRAGIKAEALTKLVTKYAPIVKRLVSKANSNIKELRKVKAEAAKGSAAAARTVKVFEAASSTQKALRRNAIQTALRTSPARTKAARAKVAHDAIRQYMPIARTPFGALHPVLQRLRKAGKAATTPGAKKAQAVASKAVQAKKKKALVATKAAAVKRAKQIRQRMPSLPGKAVATAVAKKATPTLAKIVTA